MYSYDRRTKVARRAVGDSLEAIQDTIKAAQKGLPVVTKYVRDVEEVLRFMGVKGDFLDEPRALLNGVTAIATELSPTLDAIDQLDDAMDAYARHARRKLPRGHEPITLKDLDQKIVKDFQSRAKALKKKLNGLYDTANEAPSSYSHLDDFHESPKIQALNSVSDDLDTLAIDIMFDNSDVEAFLDDVDDYLIRKVNLDE